MALIKCKECGRQVSNNAKSCPNCGNPMRGGPTVAAFEKRVALYQENQYKLIKKTDTMAELTTYRATAGRNKQAKTSGFTICLAIIAFMFLMCGIAFGNIVTLLVGILALVPTAITSSITNKVTITITPAGKIIETGNTLKK